MDATAITNSAAPMIHSRKSPRRKFIMLLQAACGTISDRRISVLAPVALGNAKLSAGRCVRGSRSNLARSPICIATIAVTAASRLGNVRQRGWCKPLKGAAKNSFMAKCEKET